MPLGTPFEIVSWNVDGIRAPGRDAALVKLATTRRPDVICLQETKLQAMHEGDWVDMLNAHGYSGFFASSTEKKGCVALQTFLYFNLIDILSDSQTT
jgi:exonuclease III